MKMINMKSLVKRIVDYKNSDLREGIKWNEMLDQQQRNWDMLISGKIARIELIKSQWSGTALTNYMKNMRIYEFIRRYLMVYNQVRRQQAAQEERDMERERVTQETIRRLRESQEAQEVEDPQEEAQDAQELERTRLGRWGLTRQRLHRGCQIAIFSGFFAVGFYIWYFYLPSGVVLPYGSAIYSIPHIINQIVDNTLHFIYNPGPDPLPEEEDVLNNIRVNERVNDWREQDRWGYLKSLVSFTIILGLLVYVGRNNGEPPISSPPPGEF